MIFLVRTPPILLMRAVSCGFSRLRLRGRSSLSTTPLTNRSHSGRRSGHLASIRTWAGMSQGYVKGYGAFRARYASDLSQKTTLTTKGWNAGLAEAPLPSFAGFENQYQTHNRAASSVHSIGPPTPLHTYANDTDSRNGPSSTAKVSLSRNSPPSPHAHAHRVKPRSTRAHLSTVERDAGLHASHAELLGVVAGEEEEGLELDGSVGAEVELCRRNGEPPKKT